MSNDGMHEQIENLLKLIKIWDAIYN
jgi:hypothetical protein